MKNQIIMWFSGMRGAVALALALHMEVEEAETKKVIRTTTLFVILFTIVFMGGSALPLIKILSDIFPDEPSSKMIRQQRRRSRKARTKAAAANGIGQINHHTQNGGIGAINVVNGSPVGPSGGGGGKGRHNSPVILSKTQEMVIFDNSEHFTECEETGEGNGRRRPQMPERKNIFTALNENFVRPFFMRKFTQQEKLENNKKLRHIAFEAMKHEDGHAPGGPHGSSQGGGGGGGGATSGPNESSSDEEVYFQSTSTLNAPNSEPAQPLLPL